jgi:hypothetical protein
MLPSSCRVPASLLVLAALAAPASAAVSHTHQADLRCYRLIGGQPLRVDLRTTLPSTPFVLFFSLNGTPSVVGNLPPIGVNLSAPFFYRFFATNPNGRFSVTLPTSPGEFGPPLSGLPLFMHVLLVGPGGQKIASNVESVQMQPAAPAPGYLVDEAATHLPAGYDQLGANSIVPVDINRDGFPDLVISTDLDVRIWMNDGQGHFADETAARITWPGDPPSTIAAGDLDRDGDPDLITGGGYDDFVSPPDRLWINDGTGHFGYDASFPEGEGLTSQVELADVDRDGNVDVLIANGIETHLANPGGKCALYFNDGAGGFVPDAAFAAGAWNDPQFEMTGIRAGDVDGDGFLDVYVVRSDTGGNDGTIGQPNVLLHNDGDGSFTDVSATMLPNKSDNSQDAQLVDLDGDGDLDIVVANSVLAVSAQDSGDVLTNQGGLQAGIQGKFLDNPSSFLEPNNFSDGIRLSVVADDLDADGDADVIVTVHDLFAGADQMLFLNQGAAQGGTEGVFVRQTWFDPTGSGLGGLGDFICWGSCAFDADHDGDREVILCGNGVVGSDPVDQFTTRFLINHKL